MNALRTVNRSDSTQELAGRGSRYETISSIEVGTISRPASHFWHDSDKQGWVKLLRDPPTTDTAVGC